MSPACRSYGAAAGVRAQRASLFADPNDATSMVTPSGLVERDWPAGAYTRT
jgi:hypothetical protein